jgi:biotin carboxyl carrier protein
MEHPADPAVGSIDVAPEFAIPETVLHARPLQRLPEDAVCRSPIAGLVIAVMACPGQNVARHQPVLIVEAMKMQNEVGANVDGVVTAMHVAPGDAVKAGQILFELA